jgi:hypothetical protein
MCEVDCCSDCGSTNILDDTETGDIVCMNCGLVLGNVEFTIPSDRITKNIPNHPIVYTRAAIGTKISSNQLAELKLAIDIHHLISQLDLPSSMDQLAISYMCKLRSATQQKRNSRKIRFTRVEIIVASIWVTVKCLNYPLSADEYVKKLAPTFKIQNLLKLEQRANYFIKNQNRLPNIALVTAHITKIVARLEHNHLLDSVYANKVCSYAIQIIHTNPGVITNRRANLVAASAILAADGLLTKRLRLLPLAKISNAGAGNVSAIAEACKRYAPPLPRDCAAIQFSYYLQKELDLC